MTVNRKRFLKVSGGIPEERKDKMTMLKKAITEGTYQIRVDDIASKYLKDLLLELALTPNGREYRGNRNN